MIANSRQAALNGVLCTLWILSTAVGCGSRDSLPSVRGTVTLNGKPLPNARVSFYPVKGRAALGVTDKAGRYQLQTSNDVHGVEEGEYRVTITTERPSTPGKGPDAESVPGSPELLPPSYSSLESSEIIRRVEAGKNRFDFSIELEPQ